MFLTTESTTVRRRQSATGSLRLRLKPAHRHCGFVQGAWWPRSTRLTVELPSLLAALSLRLGPIDRVRYHEDCWSITPDDIKHFGTNAVLEADEMSPHVITVFGTRFGQLTLLVVPPYTRPDDAYTTVVNAASVNDASTPEQLLGICPRSATEELHMRLALQRWETEGGACGTIVRH